MSAPGLDATVFVFWSGEGILAGFSLQPGARVEAGERHAAVDASAVVFKCARGDAHPTPLYVPPMLRSAMLLVLRFSIGGEWDAAPTTRQELTATAHAWAAADADARANRRRN